MFSRAACPEGLRTRVCWNVRRGSATIRPLEDRFALDQKAGKARLARHRLLTKYLQELTPSEFGA